MYNGRMVVEPSESMGRAKAHRGGRKAGHLGGTIGCKVVPPRHNWVQGGATPPNPNATQQEILAFRDQMMTHYEREWAQKLLNP
jgi:hypothetical protein